jgi:DNA-directed RNA polymerase subunit L
LETPAAQVVIICLTIMAQVQTNGKKTPVAAVEDALTALADEYSDIQDQFTVRC